MRAGGLDWTIVQPVHPTDADEPAAVSATGGTAGMKVSRRAVGHVLAGLAVGTAELGRTVSVSGAAGRVPA